MERKKQNHRVVISAGKKGHARIAILVGAGIALASVEFLCLPKLIPQPVAAARVVHGDLIIPPTVTVSVATASTSPAQPVRTGPAGPAATGPSAAPVARDDPVELVNGYLQVGFDKLAGFQVVVYHRVVDPVRLTAVPYLSRPIPDPIKSLDNRKIAIKGFMLPLRLENGRVSEFLLMRSRSFCCFGIPLRLNEWVHVRMKEKGVQSIMDIPLTVYGTLHVGEILKNGQLSSIYQLDGEKMDDPEYFQKAR